MNNKKPGIGAWVVFWGLLLMAFIGVYSVVNWIATL